ncbi:hypothetical protein PTKIN_Ptkin16aG0521500 [Pterospermum kingtungense]
MSHLLNNLNALEKSKDELDFHVGHDKLLDEADLLKLRYLQNVIFETLRLNPAVPLLVPHVSSDHCNIGGYDIPKDTMLLVNVWAIHRDPKLWGNEATSFRPERFENGKIEGYKLMPIWGRKEVLPRNGSRPTCSWLGFGVIDSMLRVEKSKCGEYRHDRRERSELAQS